MSELKDFLEQLSSDSGPGHHQLSDAEESGIGDAQPDDIFIYSDFGDAHDPDHIGSKCFDVFQKYMKAHDNAITQYMDHLGYYFLSDNDGSGNGLYYWASQWRKQ
jgi:hypothetical protein